MSPTLAPSSTPAIAIKGARVDKGAEVDNMSVVLGFEGFFLSTFPSRKLHYKLNFPPPE